MNDKNINSIEKQYEKYYLSGKDYKTYTNSIINYYYLIAKCRDILKFNNLESQIIKVKSGWLSDLDEYLVMFFNDKYGKYYVGHYKFRDYTDRGFGSKLHPFRDELDLVNHLKLKIN